MQIVFVHGAFVRDGAWWWEPAARLLDAPSLAVALPSCGEAGRAPDSAGPGLVEDAAALSAVLDAADEGAVVVAHSYGGTVLAEVGAHPALRHLVYVCSFLPEVGTPHAALSSPDSPPPPVEADGNGALRIVVDDPAVFDARFLHDVTDAGLRSGAHERLTAQSPAALTTPTTQAVWQHVESTYLVCADDRSTMPALQREHAARATNTIELATAHHPFLARPDLVAGVIGAILAG